MGEKNISPFQKLVENCLGNGIHKLLAQYHTLLIDVLSRVVT